MTAQQKDEIATLASALELSGNEAARAAQEAELIKRDPEDLDIITQSKRTEGRLKAAAAEMKKFDDAVAASFADDSKKFLEHIRAFKPHGDDENAKAYDTLNVAGRAEVVFDEAYRSAIKEVLMVVDEYAPHVSDKNPKIAFALNMYMQSMSADSPFERADQATEFVTRSTKSTSAGGPGLSREEATNLFNALHETSKANPMPFKDFVEQDGYTASNSVEDDKKIADKQEAARYQNWLKLVETFDSFLAQDPLENKWEKFKEIPGPVDNPWAGWQERHAREGAVVVDVSKGAGPLVESKSFWGKKGYEAAKPPQNEVFTTEKQIAVEGPDGKTYLKKVVCSSEVYYRVGVKVDKTGAAEAVYYKQTGFNHSGMATGVVGEYERLQQLQAAVAVEGGKKYQVPQLISEEGSPEPKMQVILVDKETYFNALSNATRSVKSYASPPPPGGVDVEAQVAAYYAKKASAQQESLRKQFVNEISGDDLMAERAQVQVNTHINRYLERLETADPKNKVLIDSIKESTANVLREYEDLGRNYGKLPRYADMATRRVEEMRQLGQIQLEDADVENRTPAYLAALEKAKQEITAEYFYKKIVLNDVALELRNLTSAEQKQPDILNDYVANLDHRIRRRVTEMHLLADVDKSTMAGRRRAADIEGDLTEVYESFARPIHNNQIGMEERRAGGIITRALERHEHFATAVFSFAKQNNLLPEAAWKEPELPTALKALADHTSWTAEFDLSRLAISIDEMTVDNIDKTLIKKFVAIYNRMPTDQEAKTLFHNMHVLDIQSTAAAANSRVAELQKVLLYLEGVTKQDTQPNSQEIYEGLLSGPLGGASAARVKEAVNQRLKEDFNRVMGANKFKEQLSLAEKRARLVADSNSRAAKGEFIPEDYMDENGAITLEGARVYAEMQALKERLALPDDTLMAKLEQNHRENLQGLEAVAVEVTPARLKILEQNLESYLVVDATYKNASAGPDASSITPESHQLIREQLAKLHSADQSQRSSADQILPYRVLWRLSEQFAARFETYSAAVVGGDPVAESKAIGEFLKAFEQVGPQLREIYVVPEDLQRLAQARGVDTLILALAYDELNIDGRTTAADYQRIVEYAQNLQERAASGN